MGHTMKKINDEMVKAILNFRGNVVRCADGEARRSPRPKRSGVGCSFDQTAEFAETPASCRPRLVERSSRCSWTDTGSVFHSSPYAG